MSGITIAVLGAAIATFLSGTGSAIGVAIAGRASAGVISEKPELFGRTLILQALPGTQGIYGFLIAILILSKIGLLGAGSADIDLQAGWTLFAAGATIGVAGLTSAIYQGKAAAAGILMTAKKPEMSARGITIAALVETYAILALLVSILIWSAI